MIYNVFILGGNENLIYDALKCVYLVWNKVIVINNTDKEIPSDQYQIITPLVPLTFTQTHNACQKIARKLKNDFYISMHDDTRFEPSLILEFADICERKFRENPKIGIIFAHYDHLMACKMEAINDIGEWDVFLPQYGSDVDYFLRWKYSKWEIDGRVLDVGQNDTEGVLVDRIVHLGAKTWELNPEFRFKSQLLEYWKNYYLKVKWGWDGYKENFTKPFDR